MENFRKLPLTAALVVMTTLWVGNVSAATITALDVRTEAGVAGDFGVTSLTVGGVVIRSTLPTGSPKNLAGFNDTTGVMGNSGNSSVGGANEAIEYDFSSLGSVAASSFVVKFVGESDVAFFLEGFPSDPGVSLSLPGFTPSYDLGIQTLQIAVDAGTPFAGDLTLTFANSVAVSSLTLSNPVFTGNGGGVSFSGIVFTAVPEPTGGMFYAVAILGFACFSRRSRG